MDRDTARKPTSINPQASRPQFPDGYGTPTDTEGLLPWTHVAERMRTARNYWVCTADTTGMPHVIPVWGVWIHDTLYFHVAPTSRTGRNLAGEPRVAIHLESGDDVVIVEGFIETIRNDVLGPMLAAEVAAASRAQYPDAFANAEPWEYQPEEGVAFAVRMTVVYAWTNLATNPTRWRIRQD